MFRWQIWLTSTCSVPIKIYVKLLVLPRTLWKVFLSITKCRDVAGVSEGVCPAGKQILLLACLTDMMFYERAHRVLAHTLSLVITPMTGLRLEQNRIYRYRHSDALRQHLMNLLKHLTVLDLHQHIMVCWIYTSFQVSIFVPSSKANQIIFSLLQVNIWRISTSMRFIM